MFTMQRASHSSCVLFMLSTELLPVPNAVPNYKSSQVIPPYAPKDS